MSETDERSWILACKCVHKAAVYVGIRTLAVSRDGDLVVSEIE